MYGKAHTEETKALISEACKGKTLSEETKAKLSEALAGKNHPNFGESLSAETKALISASKGTAIYVYNL